MLVVGQRGVWRSFNKLSILLPLSPLFSLLTLDFLSLTFVCRLLESSLMSVVDVSDVVGFSLAAGQS